MSSKALTDKIIRTAEEEAEQITADAIRRAAEAEKAIIAKAEDECNRIIALANEKAGQTTRAAKLMSGLEARKAALHAKREVINEAFAEALRKMLAFTDAEKLAYLKSLIIKYAPEAEFTLIPSALDAYLFTPAFITELESALKEKFTIVKITLGEPDADSCGGVYMVGASTDADVTYEAIFEEIRENCESQAAELLFE